jgi:hypothetical protein
VSSAGSSSCRSVPPSSSCAKVVRATSSGFVALPRASDRDERLIVQTALLSVGNERNGDLHLVTPVWRVCRRGREEETIVVRLSARRWRRWVNGRHDDRSRVGRHGQGRAAGDLGRYTH